MQFREFALEQYFGKYEFSAPYLLAQSDCESMEAGELAGMEPGGLELLTKTWLGYSENDGALALRQEISRLYASVRETGVLVHTGAQEAIFNYMHTTLNPGDHVVAMFPAYQSLYGVAEAVGCEVTLWKLRREAAGWAADLDELERLLRPNTKLLVINTPHNPTGYVFSKAELLRICGIADRRGMAVFSDEVYKGLDLDGAAKPWACDLYDKAVSLGVLSKAYGLPGLRIGWVASRDQTVIEAMSRFKNYLSICCGGVSETLACIALRNGVRILSRNLSIIQENLAAAAPFFAKYGDLFEYNPPKAGPIAFHKLNLHKPIDVFCEEMAQTAGVLLLPGSVYEWDGNYFRMGYGRKSFAENLKKFGEYLDTLSL